jgi:hypothetical protein
MALPVAFPHLHRPESDKLIFCAAQTSPLQAWLAPAAIRDPAPVIAGWPNMTSIVYATYLAVLLGH